MLGTDTFTLAAANTVRSTSASGTDQTAIKSLRSEGFIIKRHGIDSAEDIRNADIHRAAVAAITARGTADQRYVEHDCSHLINHSLFFIRKRFEIGKSGDVILHLINMNQVISDDGHNLLTSKIKRNEMEKWRINEDEVMRSALENTARLYPACVYDQRTQKEEKFMEKEFTRADITMQAPHGKMILLSSTRTTNGAAALFYPGVMQKMMKIMGGPFQAVFMNTDDVLIFDKNDNRASGFARTAKEGSMMGEMLSGKPYLCDGKQIIPGIIVNLYSDGNVEIDE